MMRIAGRTLDAVPVLVFLIGPFLHHLSPHRCPPARRWPSRRRGCRCAGSPRCSRSRVSGPASPCRWRWRSAAPARRCSSACPRPMRCRATRCRSRDDPHRGVRADHRARHHRRPRLLRYLVVPFGFSITCRRAVLRPHRAGGALCRARGVGQPAQSALRHRGGGRAARCFAAGAFFRVVLPNIRGGVLAAFIIGFVTSFNQVPVSLFLSGPGVSDAADRHAGIHGIHLRSLGRRSVRVCWPSCRSASCFLAERFLGLSRYV
jgi:hypothetical protein